MEFAKLKVFTSEDLKACTNNFNKMNLVGLIQFVKLYRGKIKGCMTGTEGQDVMVKINGPNSISKDALRDEGCPWLINCTTQEHLVNVDPLTLIKM
jgi:hypothetical protein